MNVPLARERRLLTTKQAAKRGNMSPRTLERKRLDGSGPPYQRVGRLVRYWDDLFDAWIDSGTHRSTSEYGQ
jgi:hypothetical protein